MNLSLQVLPQLLKKAYRSLPKVLMYFWGLFWKGLTSKLS